MKLNPKPAERKGQTMRSLVFGLSGSGKTLYALEIARVLTDDNMNRVLVIDSENESSGLYSDEYQFMTQAWEGDHDPVSLAELIRQADDSGDFDVIVVDGASPFWDGKGGTLDIVEEANKRNPKGFNWSIGTARQNDLMERILNTRAHLIVTCRGKNFTPEEKDAALAHIKVKPVQRDTFFYEFNTCIYVYPNHSSEVVKTRCRELHQARFPADGGAVEYAETEKSWLQDNTKYASKKDIERLKQRFDEIPETNRKHAKTQFLQTYGAPDKLTEEMFKQAFNAMDNLVKEYSMEEPWPDSPNDEVAA